MAECKFWFFVIENLIAFVEDLDAVWVCPHFIVDVGEILIGVDAVVLKSGNLDSILHHIRH